MRPVEHSPASANAPAEMSLHEAMDRTVRLAGADPDHGRGMRVREIIHTAAKLLRDEADLGEVKLISRSVKELRYALKVFRQYRDIRKISMFGSARTPVGHRDYAAAVAFAQRMAKREWMVITGAGDGIMRAGNHGAKRERSFGVSIRLPFETNANDFIKGDSKLITFRYFFTRKLIFIWQSSAIALFPGGFGTQDESFEALTLIQTGKAPMMPVVMIDAEGSDYWQRWDDYVRGALLDNGWISPEDTSLYRIFHDPAEAADHVIGFYRNYHSERFVRDTHVLRIRRPLTEKQLAALSEEFADLIKHGTIEQGGPLKEERGRLPELPRLYWASRKRGYGRLRQMIDRLNAFDAENA